MQEIEAYEWDDAKRRSNFSAHGVDFVEVTGFDWDCSLTFDQHRDNETRHLSYAPMKNRLYALVWALRGLNIRLISFRKANKREVLLYEKAQPSDQR